MRQASRRWRVHGSVSVILAALLARAGQSSVKYRTSSNGTIVVTGLKAGTRLRGDLSAPDGYVITDATETIYLFR